MSCKEARLLDSIEVVCSVASNHILLHRYLQGFTPGRVEPVDIQHRFTSVFLGLSEQSSDKRARTKACCTICAIETWDGESTHVLNHGLDGLDFVRIHCRE